MERGRQDPSDPRAQGIGAPRSIRGRSNLDLHGGGGELRGLILWDTEEGEQEHEGEREHEEGEGQDRAGHVREVPTVC